MIKWLKSLFCKKPEQKKVLEKIKTVKRFKKRAKKCQK